MLTFIRENLEKSDQLTRGMVTILSSFESRLVQLENAIIPVHTQTENLQRLQDNVDRTLSCLDHVISYYHVAKDADRVVREGSVAGAVGLGVIASVVMDLWCLCESQCQLYSLTDVLITTCNMFFFLYISMSKDNTFCVTFNTA